MNKGVSFLSYVQLLDSALPIGGFSHSFGLESYVQQGRITDVEQLERYMTGQIHAGLVRLEGLAIKGTYLAMNDNDMWKIILFDKIVHVQRIPRESREGLHKMGKRLLRLAKMLYPWIDFAALEESLALHGGYGTLPIAFAWISRRLDVDLDTAVNGYLYSAVTTMANSALRLMPIGQTEGQILIRRMQQVAQREWAAVRDLPIDRLHAFTPAHDIRAMQHETLYSRLFMS